MTRIVRLLFAQEDEQDAANRQTASLAGLAVTLLLVVVSLYLLRQLRASSAAEDCLLSGSRSCDTVLIASH